MKRKSNKNQILTSANDKTNTLLVGKNGINEAKTDRQGKIRRFIKIQSDEVTYGPWNIRIGFRV